MKIAPIMMALSILAVTLAPVSAAASVDPFYQRLLQNGNDAYHRGDHGDARRLLRIACFGMLEEPQQLADCLVRLGLAQIDTGDEDAFRATARRLLNVEQRFEVYAKAAIQRPLRERFEDNLVQLMPAYALESVATFRTLVSTSEGTTNGGPTNEGTASEGTTSEGTTNDAVPAEQGETQAAPTGQPEQSDQSTPSTLSAEDREQLRLVREQIRLASLGEELEDPLRMAREVADRHPESSEAQHLVAEIAYRASSWEDAADYFQRGGVPADTQPVLQFFMAVSLYESGDKARAAAVMQRCLPTLQKTDFVSSYENKILGQP